MEKLPNEPIVQFHYGMAQYKNGDAAGAKKALQASLKLSQRLRRIRRSPKNAGQDYEEGEKPKEGRGVHGWTLVQMHDSPERLSTGPGFTTDSSP